MTTVAEGQFVRTFGLLFSLCGCGGHVARTLALMQIRSISHLSSDDIQPLLTASVAEGYGFVQKLWDEYCENVYEQPNAFLFGGYDVAQLVAVEGIGQQLIQALIAQSVFSIYTLRTMTEHGR